MALDCLTGLVGLANRDCPCLSGGQPSGFNDSESGYYLDDREYGFPVKAAEYANLDCGENSIWDMMAEARTQGIRDLKNDLMQSLTQVRESRVINWRGLIGKAEGTGSFISTNTYAGIQLRPRIRMKDNYFMLKAVYININATKSVDFSVTSNDGTFTPFSDTVSCTANTWTRHEFSSAVSLPMYSIGTEDIRYNVAYQPDGAGVRQNKLWCCSKKPWMDHLDAGSFDLDALPDSQELLPTHTICPGIALEGYFTCNKLDWICDLKEMNGVDTRDMIARLIQVKGAIHLITAVLRSDKVNKYTLLNQEGMYRQRNFLKEYYSNGILWIAQNLPGGVSSCWGCERAAPQVTPLIL